MRYLGAFPSEKDMVESVLPDVGGGGAARARGGGAGGDAGGAQVQEDEPTAFVTYEKFEKKMLEVLESGEFAPEGEDMLLQAFRVRGGAARAAAAGGVTRAARADAGQQPEGVH